MNRDPIQPGAVPPDVLQDFLSTSPDLAVICLDKTGIISSWNAGAERMKGYFPAEIVGKHFSILFPRAEIENKLPQFLLTRALQAGRVEDEGWRVRKDGTLFWAEEVITPVKASDGTLRGFVKVTRDRSTRRVAEEAARIADQRFRLLVQGVRDYAIFLLDAEGHVMTWNEGAQRLKGYHAEEIIGHHFRTFYTPEDQTRRHPEEELAIAVQRGSYEEEGERVRKDGTRFWARVTITALRGERGDIVGFAKVTRDLTDRKRSEEEIKQRNAELAAANRELDAFGHAAAHDLRAPVRAVHELAEGVLRDEAETLSEAARENLEAIRTSAERMSLLVNNLLELSRGGNAELSRERVDLSALAQEVADAIRQRHPARHADFRIQPGLEALADRNLLRIALTNLMRNASKFARDRDPAHIEVGRATTSDGEAFFVRDNGVGFDPARSNKLFVPFSRLHGAQYEGSGIGLTTVRRIVERHGGRVWADSSPGRGATFYFTIPEP